MGGNNPLIIKGVQDIKAACTIFCSRLISHLANVVLVRAVYM